MHQFNKVLSAWIMETPNSKYGPSWIAWFTAFELHEAAFKVKFYYDYYYYFDKYGKIWIYRILYM